MDNTIYRWLIKTWPTPAGPPIEHEVVGYVSHVEGELVNVVLTEEGRFGKAGQTFLANAEDMKLLGPLAEKPSPWPQPHGRVIRRWNHSRKGELEGYLVSLHGEWLDIELTKDCRHGNAGEIITVRSAFTMLLEELT